jgi:hypothetical protein
MNQLIITSSRSMMHSVFRGGSDVVLSWNVSSGTELTFSMAFTLQESEEFLSQQWITTTQLKQ